MTVVVIAPSNSDSSNSDCSNSECSNSESSKSDIFSKYNINILTTEENFEVQIPLQSLALREILSQLTWDLVL